MDSHDTTNRKFLPASVHYLPPLPLCLGQRLCPSRRSNCILWIVAFAKLTPNGRLPGFDSVVDCGCCCCCCCDGGVAMCHDTVGCCCDTIPVTVCRASDRAHSHKANNRSYRGEMGRRTTTTALDRESCDRRKLRAAASGRQPCDAAMVGRCCSPSSSPSRYSSSSRDSLKDRGIETRPAERLERQRSSLTCECDLCTTV